MREGDDDALLRAVRAGEPGAFEELVRRHQRLVWHVVQRLVRHREDTLELCQETFLRVHQRLHQFRGDSRLGTWIARIAWHLAVRHLERRRLPLAEGPPGAEFDSAEAGAGFALEQLADPLDLEARMADVQLQQRLLQAIENLPPLQRLLLTLYHLEEQPIAELVQITGLPAGTIKSHLFRSRERLRQMLAADAGIAPG
ncbi:MAG: sigma-70 family RNA polymerase sigma factor [Rubrivivax sp.]|nr:sigma-70 family RNA polymerase sigma factor [Rubrivivax sp.]